ncbi:MAG TPA: tetratricopeptide repeat protein [Usitatibacter sp.]|jgi:class 3 adenylate cyclase/tetratricopeptide (TPR) repeat protein|nr:tetratricopeptide repeat protein [Usitatibacter sp.]
MQLAALDQAIYPSRVVRTVVFVDMVESGRLIEAHEQETVRRWRELVSYVEQSILPAQGGRKVKSLGDGMLLEFPDVPQAALAAFAIQRECAARNAGLPSDRHMYLRAGMHVSAVIAHEEDVYGHGVNLAARLMALAGPGEVVASADARDRLTSDLDADIEDLGPCYLKHVTEPLRAYRLGPPGPRPLIERGTSAMPELVPTIAVIPFIARTTDVDHDVFGEVLADEIIAALSRTASLRVISRLSTTAFRGREGNIGEVTEHLRANYMLSGAYRISGDRVSVTVQLADVASGAIAWTQVLEARISAILHGDDPLVERIMLDVGSAILKQELERARTLPLPTLASYTLLMGAIVLMHRGAPQDFDRAGSMLEALTERAPRQAIPHAWLAKWHVLRYNRGRTDDKAVEAKIALDSTKRALDSEPDCALALTIDGFVHTNLLMRCDVGEERYAQALESNPNESLAWLLKGTLHAFKGEGDAAVESTERALMLSPLDPLRYFYESLAATAAHSAGHYERAIELAKKALRANRVHPSTYRALAIAQSQLGRMEEARKTVEQLMRIQPDLTVSSYLESNPSGQFETGKVWAEALRRAGVPN